MGNQRFKLSDMMPNAWFYKLRDMNKVKVQKMQMPPTTNPRFTFTDPPTNRKTVFVPSTSPDQSYLSFKLSVSDDIIIDLPPAPAPIHTARNSSAGVKIRRKKPQPRGRSRRYSEEKQRKKKKKKTTTTKGMFYSESFAIVKASFDPEKDFEESMMEMIVENNIRDSKDLEDLLACYLSLNSNQYHPIIIKAFEQIWFTMPPHHF